MSLALGIERKSFFLNWGRPKSRAIQEKDWRESPIRRETPKKNHKRFLYSGLLLKFTNLYFTFFLRCKNLKKLLLLVQV